MRVLDRWQTSDGGWVVEVVKYGRDDTWYRLTHGGETHDRLAIGVVQWMLAEAGLSMADLEQVAA